MSWAGVIADMSFDPRPLIADYFARGGCVQHVPFAVSGYHTRARVLVAGRRGWIKKYGITFVPAEARDVVAAGLITIAEARVDLVYGALFAVRETRPTLTDIGRMLGFYPHQVRAVIDVLERDNFVRRAGHALIATAGVRHPTWTHYVRAA